jgi:hypothetical protein
VENVAQNADIDLFLVTEGDRLWIVQWRAMRCRHHAARRGVDVCPNYLLTHQSLALDRRDLHRAREVAHVVPLWGAATYERFLEANRWIFDFLPNLDLEDRRRLLANPVRSPSKERWESRLGGSLGNAVDRVLHRLLLLYYAWRLRRHGIAASQLRAAYRRDRQEVVGGGYGSAIRERFLRRVSDELGSEASLSAGERFFPSEPPPEGAVALYGQQLVERYGDRP